MGTVRELENLKEILESQRQEINDLKEAILKIETILSDYIKKKDKISINKSSKENNNDLSIIFTKYK